MLPGKRILVVDDERDILDSLEEVLPLLIPGVTVTTALSGPEALQYIAADSPFDLIISDQRMPQMTGIEFLAQVRTRTPQVPCILYTAFDASREHIQAELGNIVDEVLPKASEIQTISEVVQRHLANPATV